MTKKEKDSVNDALDEIMINLLYARYVMKMPNMKPYDIFMCLHYLNTAIKDVSKIHDYVEVR